MKSAISGKRFSRPEVTEINDSGFWLDLGDETVFLDYEVFPWFRKAPAEAVRRVDRQTFNHLRWPSLDIDLDIDSLHHPEKYPLKGHYPDFN